MLAAALIIVGADAFAQKNYRELNQISRLNRGVSGLRSMADGEHYTVSRGNVVIRHSYSDESVCDTLYRGRFSSYELSPAEDMIVLKAGSYYAFAGGKQVRLDASSTKATLMGRGNEFYLPKTFVEEVIGVSCEGLTTYDHYGITYVMPAEAIAAAGKAITITAEGLVVISTTAIEDGDVLTTLYRALM